MDGNLGATYSGRTKWPMMTGSRPGRQISLCSIFLLILFLMHGPLVGIADSQPQEESPLKYKKILVLHAFDPNLPIFELTDRGLRASLDAGGVIIRNRFFEYLDLARNPGPEHRELLVEQMRMRYGRRKFDVIVTMYPEALEFVLKDCRDIFPEAPIAHS